jgi:probable F420-dependent oxidoreductase
MMRFGLALPSFSFSDLDYEKAVRLRDFARRAERLGYESLWVVEHLLTARGLYGTAWLSPLETLSFAAGCTARIRLATGILIPPLRNPVFVAKDIASLQYLSGGRFELGIGVGWDAHEYEVAGVPLKERGRRTDEILDILEKLWTGEPVTHHGRYYHFDDVVIDPPLPKKPPLWVAGGSKSSPSCRPILKTWRARYSSGSAGAATVGSPAPPDRPTALSATGHRSRRDSPNSAAPRTASSSAISISCTSCRPTTRRRRYGCSGR